MADSDVKLKHKVQLRKKVEEQVDATPDQAPIQEPVPVPETVPTGIRKTNWWLYICGGIVIIGLIIWLFCEMAWKDKHQGNEGLMANQTLNENPVNIEENNENQQEEINLPVNEEENISANINEPTVEDNSNTDSPIEPQEVTQSVNSVSPTSTTTSTTSNVSNSNVIVSNDVEKEAMKVIHGDYGDGQERKDKLGDKYHDIQSRVNELKRQGVF